MTDSSIFLIGIVPISNPWDFSLSQKAVECGGFGTSLVKNCCPESEHGKRLWAGRTDGQGDVAHHKLSSLFVGFLLA